ncbi:MAG: hypothetical protein GWM87_14645 [Xanthomonadales bacterium]|nr:hypothetical protein [Xanthomonadales bacterium]NIX14033.1 hypothetical protein [Xanthomonadales bacterium]
MTALELAVGLAIVALAVALGVPSLREHGLNQRMKAAVSTFFSDLALARNTAISRNARTVACPAWSDGGCAAGAEWQDGWLVFEDRNGDREWQAGEPRLRRSGALEQLRIAGSPHRNRLRFFPDGSAPGSNATFTFCDVRGVAHARRVIVSASGRIRQTRPGEAPATACDS